MGSERLQNPHIHKLLGTLTNYNINFKYPFLESKRVLLIKLLAGAKLTR